MFRNPVRATVSIARYFNKQQQQQQDNYGPYLIPFYVNEVIASIAKALIRV